MSRAKITLSRSALTENYRILSRKVPGQKLLPMVKANAYGHGSVFTATSLLNEKNLHGFGVANFDEGILLRKAMGRSDIPIIVFSDSAPWTQFQSKICEQYQLEPVLSEISSLIQFQSQKNASIRAHLEINTGMNRMGIRIEDISLVNFKPTSVFTHFADADDPKSKLSQKQTQGLKEIIDISRERFPEALLHFANSSGIWNAKAFPLTKNMHLARPGLSLYGVKPYPDAKNEGLRRVMRFTAPIVNRIFLKSGDRVGYGGSYTCKNARGEWIAIIGAGYADGVFRSLSSKGIVMVGKKKFELRGRVSMDLAAMSSNSKLEIGDIVELWGDSVDPYAQSKLAGTVPYEMTTRIGERVERIYE